MKPQRILLAPGQESVWDYPRPPRVQATSKHIQVVLNGIVIAETRQAQRVLETSHPPVYYVPPQDIRSEFFKPGTHQTFCEFKGGARYYTVSVGNKTVENAAWYYPNPTHAFQAIKNHVAFYPSLMDACFVDGEQVTAQAGDFYGGWITREIVGPFKGDAGTWGW